MLKKNVKFHLGKRYKLKYSSAQQDVSSTNNDQCFL